MAEFRLVLVILLMTTSICTLQASDSNSSVATTLGVLFERAPESAVAPKGDEVVFECELNLKPDRLEWRFRRSDSAEPYRYLRPAAGYNVTSGSDGLAWRLRIYVSAQTAGDYQCVAWYGPGALASTPARLALVSIALDGGQGSMAARSSIRWSVAPKNCLLIRCGSVVSNPPAIWSFYRNGKKLPQSELLAGAAGALVLDTVTAKDAGNYSCVATNSITGDELRLPQTIELRVDYTDRTPPYFLQRPPTEYSARPGETVVLECPGVGSPRPRVIWSSPNVVGIYNNRSNILPYGLQITDVRPEDQGSYICMLDNGIAPPIDHTIKLSVLQRPTILRGPAATLTNESNPLLLDCSASGNPQPDIYWLINGEDATKDPEAVVDNRSLQLKRVQKRHAGVVQCFAKNILGETSEGNILRVNPLEITGEDEEPLGGVPVWPVHESNIGMGSSSTPAGGSKNKSGRRKFKASMVPPSRPNVTRLSDESVMLRWSVPQNSGLQITFFKVQYRKLGDGKNRRENWQTTSDNIPYGNAHSHGSGPGLGNGHWRARNRDREYEMGNPPKNFTSSVTGLTAGKYYRFRIVAVYSNNDNKEGNTSLKFFLQNGTAQSNLPVPELRVVETLSESALVLHWSSPDNEDIDGYYVYYRPADSAAEYLKATVDGARSRSFKMDLLRPGTAYEFKLQSFNSDAASEFSAIRQARTRKAHEQPASSSSTPVPANKTVDQHQNSVYPVIAGAAGGGILLLIASLVVCLCLRRRENAQPEDENKPQLEHIQADFVTSAVLGAGGHHKSGDVRRLNGVIPRMNITPNPLAQETASDKNRNVMELRFLPPLANGNGNGNGNCIARDLALERPNAEEQQDEDGNEDDRGLPAVASSSCETLEACDATIKLNLHQKPGQEQLDAQNAVLEAPSKPLPPLPKKPANGAGQNNSGLHQNGMHHAQPYHPPGTPTLMHKRLDYHQQPPPVPPHSAYYQQAPTHQPSSMMERSVRGHQPGGYYLEEGTPTPTRIPSLRRQRRTSGNQQVHNSHSNLNISLSHHNNNNNLPPHHQHLHHHPGHPGGLVGIPIVPGSPRVQRSPMPSRAMIKRTRLGSHTDNISSGSLNSIEV
ncbi:interference hedgehog isoform X1 [Drosophila santomea]|uniref:interference hedgehog isoform X1 n=1 Tax=Drosophila santomea TaxID=129105 RepID=UPI0019537112|nr:interference hedgehog isoform X1 [Drosophila santomea]XP_039497352.1 interference hedgehog isoform X1 [Drosophila santomea]XP_039497353.1 interference hedgehog isoform X1 [Drosophila santomea]